MDIEKKIEIILDKLAFDTEARVTTYDMIASMLEDGLALDQCLRDIYEDMAVRKHPLRSIFKRWIIGLNQGRSFSDVIGSMVPPQELVLISAGERSQKLAEGLKRAIDVTLAGIEMRSAITGALANPIFLLLALMGMIVGFSIEVAPTLAKVLPPAEWRGSAKYLYHLSEFMRNWWAWVLAGLFGTGFAIYFSLDVWVGEMRNRFDKAPPWTIYRTYVSSTFMMALASLLKSGISIDEALKYIKKSSAPWLKSHISIMQKKLNMGSKYGTALDTGMLSEDVAGQIKIYEKIARFDKAILSIGERSIKKGIKRIQKQASVAKVIIIALVGFTLAWIYATTFELNMSVAKKASQTQRR